MPNLKNIDYETWRNVGFLLLILPAVFAFILLFIDDGVSFAVMGKTVYADKAGLKRCAAGSRKGKKGASYAEKTLGGLKYDIRTPLNYDASIAHPLLMVYAPAKANRSKNERLTGLTRKATTAGFIVAYADHVKLSAASAKELGTIPGQIAKKWCIDEERVYLTGHSDGGTVAMALAFMKETSQIPTAIAPSGAGVTYRDLSEHACPEPISVMVMHSKNDRLFPGLGEETSGWWAACNDCSPTPEKLSNGCIAYKDCTNGVKTWYCEGTLPHSKWPQLNGLMLEFLASSRRR